MANIVILADTSERQSSIAAACMRPGVDAVLYTSTAASFDPSTESALAGCEIVVIDHSESGSEQLQLVDSIRSAHPDARILVSGIPDQRNSDHTDLVFEYLEHGASGYVTKSQAHQLSMAVETVAGGGAWIEPRLTTELVERTVALRDALASMKPHTFGSGQPDLLTRRQIEVLELLAAGKTNREIADALFISIGTVKNHVHRILDTLQASSRDEAAGYYQFLQEPAAAL